MLCISKCTLWNSQWKFDQPSSLGLLASDTETDLWVTHWKGFTLHQLSSFLFCRLLLTDYTGTALCTCCRIHSFPLESFPVYSCSTCNNICHHLFVLNLQRGRGGGVSTFSLMEIIGLFITLFNCFCSCQDEINNIPEKTQNEAQIHYKLRTGDTTQW